MTSEELKARNSVDLLLRTTQQNHLELSVMADQKANIIIAFCSVVFSVSLARMNTIDLNWGFLTLMISSAAAMVTAILTLIPRTKVKNIKKADLNPLFFGHFTQYTADEYRERMKDLIQKDEQVYEALIHDIYQSGLVLRNRKYRYLRISYLIFFGGICLSLLLFLLQLVL
ncbi:MAG: DUF5706 domain-containing protein [Spirochaetales bacterium]|nr:DUF5706 domain-containing protein [Spirochaetales bacterium]